jgi:hypothetical protein
MLVITTALVVLYAFVTTRTGSRRQGGISRVTCCLLLNIARAF